MSRAENTKALTYSVNWSGSLSSRQRVLLHAQPLIILRQQWAMRDEAVRYDPMCLSMKLFDVVIDQSGFGNEVVRETISQALLPLLDALDRSADVVPDRHEHQRVIDRLLNGLLNESHYGQAFSLEYSEFDDAGQATRKTFSFKLLKEVHGYSGEVALQLSSEAINLFLNALALDIESEQIANEAVVQYQLERGKFDKARSSAENARGQSLRYEEKIHRIIEQTKRDIRQVRWRDEVHEILVDGLLHVHQRLKIEDGIIRSATDKLDVLSEGDDKSKVIRDIIGLMKDCRHRHLNLNKVLMSARGAFLEQQSRQCFVDISLSDVVNLRDDVLGQLLSFGREHILPLCEQTAPLLVGPVAPQLLSLVELLKWQLQPRRLQATGESAIVELELSETDVDRHRFDADVLQDVAKVFAILDQPIRLSNLLTSLEEDGCPIAVQDAVVLQVFEYFDPEDELIPFQVNLAAANGLATSRCHGDDLWIEPMDNDHE